LNIGAAITGVNVQTTTSASLPVAPPTARAVTVTSSDPSIVTISTSPTVAGTASVTFPNVSNAGGLPALYLQGQKVGSTTVTVSANGYTDGTATITVYPSGFTYATNYTSGFTTTSFSSATSIYVYPSLLSPGTLNYYTANNVYLSPGLGTISIPVTSSNTNVGNITLSPVVFNAGDGYKATSFQPSSAGTSTIAIGATPAGFTTPAQYTQITATVTAPALNIGSVLTGSGMEVATSASLPVAPPNPVTVTITSNDPTTALISKSATTPGTASLTFTNVTNAGGLPAIYVQGQAVASTTLTVSAPGYTNGTGVVTVNPSGFTFATNYSGGLNTTVSANPTALYVYPSILNTGTLTYYSTNVALNPAGSPVSVMVTSSDTNTGTITTSPVVFNGGDQYQMTNFKPKAAGTSTITIVPPQGYSTPTQYTQINATVQ
jgi:hypothetical protein